MTHTHTYTHTRINRLWSPLAYGLGGNNISSVYTACARMIGILRRLDGTIRSPAMKRIYTAVICPRMEYACAVWSGGPTGCLQRLQDSFAKRHSLSLPPLEKRFEYHTLVLFYRVRANLAPTYLGPGHTAAGFSIMIGRGRSGRDRKILQRGHTTFSVSR